jgi:hypothetical protein
MEPTSEVLTAAITVNAEWLAAMLCYAEGEGVKRMRRLQLRQEARREEAKEARQDLRATLGLGPREVIPPEDNAEKDATLNPIPGVKLYRVVANGETVAGGMTWVGARSERADRYRNDPSGHYTILADASEPIEVAPPKPRRIWEVLKITDAEVVATGLSEATARYHAEEFQADDKGHRYVTAEAEVQPEGVISPLGDEVLKKSIPGQEAYAVVRMTDWHPVARGIRWEQARKEQDRRGGMPKYGIVVDSSEEPRW